MIRLRFFLTFLLSLQSQVLQASHSPDLRLLLNDDEREKLFPTNPGIIDRGKYQFEMIKPDLVFGLKVATGIFFGSMLANMEYEKIPIAIPTEDDVFLNPKNDEILLVYLNENDQNESTINIEEKAGRRRITLKEGIPIFIEKNGRSFLSPLIENESIRFENNISGKIKIGNFFLKKDTILFITKNDEEFDIYYNPDKTENKAPFDFLKNKKKYQLKIKKEFSEKVSQYFEPLIKGITKTTQSAWNVINNYPKITFAIGASLLVLLGSRSINRKNNPSFEQWFDQKERKRKQKFIFEKIENIMRESARKTEYLKDIQSDLQNEDFLEWIKNTPPTKEQEILYNDIIETFQTLNKNKNTPLNWEKKKNNSEINKELLKKILLYREFQNRDFPKKKNFQIDFLTEWYYKNDLTKKKTKELQFLMDGLGNINPTNDMDEKKHALVVQDIQLTKEKNNQYFDTQNNFSESYGIPKKGISSLYPASSRYPLQNPLEAEHYLKAINETIEKRKFVEEQQRLLQEQIAQTSKKQPKENPHEKQ